MNEDFRPITRSMILAGADVLAEQWGVIGSGPAAEELAEAVFKAMLEKSIESLASFANGHEAHPGRNTKGARNSESGDN
ncbi:hypothetical protein [Hyphomonas sp.]|uniref:hypothetical protein n=1 Tax=Hyphomonas sp. TaxID=87 RepID=UPI001BCF2ADE|nr:hypothetical protein [Hyphomonas sp.]